MLALLLTSNVIGWCTYYNKGLMEQVYQNRLAWGHVQPCPECVGFAAMVDPEWIGKKVWITRPGQRSELFLVVDCGKEEHRAGQHARGLVVEVDFQTAKRWRMTGPIRVIVSPFNKHTPRGEIP